MTLPLILCTLIALTSGLHFGREFAQMHRTGSNMILPVLAHAAVSAALMVVSVLLDQTPGNMIWMIVAIASMGGMAIGALMPERRVVPARQQQAEASNAAVHTA